MRYRTQRKYLGSSVSDREHITPREDHTQGFLKQRDAPHMAKLQSVCGSQCLPGKQEVPCRQQHLHRAEDNCLYTERKFIQPHSEGEQDYLVFN